MAKIPSFNNSYYTIPTVDFADWRRRLIDLHTYPSEVWDELETSPISSALPVSRWRRRLEEELPYVSSEPSRDNIDYIAELLRRGDLIPPHSGEAGEIDFLRRKSPSLGLSKLIERLEEKSAPHRQASVPDFERESTRHALRAEERLRHVELLQTDIAELAARLLAMEEEAKRSELARKADAEASKLASQRWFDERHISLEALRKDLDARSENAKAQLDKWFKEKESDINGAKEALRTSFATEAAHTYWATHKFKRHSDLAVGTRRIGYAYMAAVLTAAATALLLGSHLNQPLWQTPLSIAIPFAVVVIGIIWVGRILGRTYMAHMQLAEDAKERATMIETYIALIRADVIDKTKADEAQRALFRPAATGLLAGDSGPDTPIELVTKAVSGGR